MSKGPAVVESVGMTMGDSKLEVNTWSQPEVSSSYSLSQEGLFLQGSMQSHSYMEPGFYLYPMGYLVAEQCMQ